MKGDNGRELRRDATNPQIVAKMLSQIASAISTSGQPVNDRVWIHAHVEDMQERDEYVSYSRAEWEAMSEQERDDAIEQAAADAVSNAGGYGAGVVDEADVPEEWKR